MAEAAASTSPSKSTNEPTTEVADAEAAGDSAASVSNAPPRSAANNHNNKCKIFVGNLPAEANKVVLKELFGKSGKIVSIKILSKYRRLLYCFITFEEESAVQVAVDEFNGFEFHGNAIIVQPAADKPPRQATVTEAAPANGTESGEAVPARGGRGALAGRGRGRASGRGARKAKASTTSSNGEAPARLDMENNETASGEPHSVAAATNPESNGNTAVDGENGEKRPRGRGGRASRHGRNGRGRNGRNRPRVTDENAGPVEMSKTVLFIGNLPYKLEDDDLRSILKDYDVVSAQVVKNGNRSHGFGFVEVSSETEQQRLLSEVKELEVGGRVLIVNPAKATESRRRKTNDKPAVGEDSAAPEPPSEVKETPSENAT